MGRTFAYQVKVGQNVPSLKSGPGAEKPCFVLESLAPGKLEAATPKRRFEVPTALVLAGLIVAATGYWISGREELPAYAAIGLGALAGLGGAALLVYGIGIISARQRLIIGGGAMKHEATFFWFTRRRVLEKAKPEAALCLAARLPGEASRYTFHCCLRLGEPPGTVSVFQLDGYAQIRQGEALRRKPYETALLEIHEKAVEIAKALEIPLRSGFSNGPVTDELKAMLEDEESGSATGADASGGKGEKPR